MNTKNKRKIWSTNDNEQMRRDYADTPTHILANRFGCSVGAVYCKADVLGLRKSAAYLAGPAACRLRRGDKIGAATRFELGQRFPTSRPVGAERISQNGYRQRKVTATGYSPRDWVGLHILLWREHRGAVPPGHIVVFRNGNKTDIQIDNLELITRAELMRRNTIHRYPPALKQTIRLAGKLRRKIHEKQD